MSLRTKEVADEASRFTLRSIFSHGVAEDVMNGKHTPTQQPHIKQTSQSLGHIKFELPFMRPNCHASVNVKEKLQADYITGGTKNLEIMRLMGVIEDMKTKLTTSSGRISTAEQSVARGNAALQSERFTSHARIVALASEVKNSQHREATMRTQLDTVPILATQNRVKFEMQESCAVELQKSFKQEIERANALELVIKGMHVDKETSTAEHAALLLNLNAATTELERIQSHHEVVPDSLLKHKIVSQMDALDDSNNFVTVGQQQEDASIEIERLCKINASAERQIDQLDEKLVLARLAATEANKQTEKAQMEKYKAEEEMHKLKSDSILHTTKEETQTMCKLEKGVLQDEIPLPNSVVTQLQKYSLMKQSAENATGVVQCAGQNATRRMIDNAMHTNASARRAYWKMVNDEPDHRGTMSCAVVSNGLVEKQSDIDVHALQMQMETKMNTNHFKMGVACVSSDNMGIDLHDVMLSPRVVGTAVQAAATSLNVKNDYVTAVTADIYKCLGERADAWRCAGMGP